jgi:hypothetical protein
MDVREVTGPCQLAEQAGWPYFILSYLLLSLVARQPPQRQCTVTGPWRAYLSRACKEGGSCHVG